jgi:hypothetical protein
MSHQEQIVATNDELTNAVLSVVESFEPYRADHRPDCADFDRWLIWNDKTSERLGIVKRRYFCVHARWICCAMSRSSAPVQQRKQDRYWRTTFE